ncbi:hypothetical protein ACSQ67_020914 [Phaseolus vulgaris]
MSGITRVAPRLLATIIRYYQQTQSEIEKLGLLRKIKKGEGKLIVSTIAQSLSLARSLSLHCSRSIVLTPSLGRSRSNAHDPLLNHVHGHVQSRTKCSNAPLAQSRSKCSIAQSRSKCSNAPLLSCSNA